MKLYRYIGFYSEFAGIKTRYEVKGRKEKGIGDIRMSTNINKFYGDVNNSQIQQNTNNSSQNMVINDYYDKKEELIRYVAVLKENINKIELTEDKINTVINSIKKIETEVNDKVRTSVIKEGLSTIRNVLEGVAVNVIASGLIHQLGHLL